MTQPSKTLEDVVAEANAAIADFNSEQQKLRDAAARLTEALFGSVAEIKISRINAQASGNGE